MRAGKQPCAKGHLGWLCDLWQITALPWAAPAPAGAFGTWINWCSASPFLVPLLLPQDRGPDLSQLTSNTQLRKVKLRRLLRSPVQWMGRSQSCPGGSCLSWLTVHTAYDSWGRSLLVPGATWDGCGSESFMLSATRDKILVSGRALWGP